MARNDNLYFSLRFIILCLSCCEILIFKDRGNIHKIGLMLRKAVVYNAKLYCKLHSRNHWERIGELCFPPLRKCNSPMGKTVSQASEKMRENSSKNLCETGGEREMKGNFVFTTSFNCTVLYFTQIKNGHHFF